METKRYHFDGNCENMILLKHELWWDKDKFSIEYVNIIGKNIWFLLFSSQKMQNDFCIFIEIPRWCFRLQLFTYHKYFIVFFSFAFFVFLIDFFHNFMNFFSYFNFSYIFSIFFLNFMIFVIFLFNFSLFITNFHFLLTSIIIKMTLDVVCAYSKANSNRLWNKSDSDLLST